MSIEAPAPRGIVARWTDGQTIPVLIVVLVIGVFWYLGAMWLNADLQRDLFANGGKTEYTTAELTKSEDGGFGARLLAGSYYGQTIQIWAALFAAAACAWMLVTAVGVVERGVSKQMGARP